jgi:hypothetical protein
VFAANQESRRVIRAEIGDNSNEKTSLRGQNMWFRYAMISGVRLSEQHAA